MAIKIMFDKAIKIMFRKVIKIYHYANVSCTAFLVGDLQCLRLVVHFDLYFLLVGVLGLSNPCEVVTKALSIAWDTAEL
jgi:hypothetical protein